jgi:hypothetical protein
VCNCSFFTCVNLGYNDEPWHSFGGALAAQDAELHVTASHFEDTAALIDPYTGGGAIGAMYFDERKSAHISHCTFLRTTASGPGASVFIYFRGDFDNLQGLVIDISDSTFESGNGWDIVHVQTWTPFQNAVLKVSNCHFKNITTTGGDSCAINVYFEGNVEFVSIQIVDSTFKDIAGSGIRMMAMLGKVADIMLDIANCSFIRCLKEHFNNVGGSGGGISLSAFNGNTWDPTKSISVSITACHFQENKASGRGGAVFLDLSLDETSGVTITISENSFISNRAGKTGGAVYIALPQGHKANLNFVGNPAALRPVSNPDDPCSSCQPFPDCSGCPAFNYYKGSDNPVIPIQHVYRRWYNLKNMLVVNSSYFTANIAMDSGGGLAMETGGSGTVMSCMFEGNIATRLSGGGTSVTGTAQVSFENTQWKNNTCGLDGCQVSQASSAGVNFKNSTIELGCAKAAGGTNCRQGLSAAEAGNVTWDTMAGMSCGPGYTLTNESVLAYPKTLESWALNLGTTCSSDGTDSHSLTNCPCYFGPMTKHSGFGNSTVLPEMLVTQLAYSCHPCSAGKFSAVPVHLMGNENATEAGSCMDCPPGRHQPTAGKSMCLVCPVGQSQAIAGQKACTPCPQGRFQLDSGASNCVLCPFGGTCKGSLIPKADYYGSRTPNGEYIFTRCPDGYCIGNIDEGGDHGGTGVTYAQCMNDSQRDFTQPLCGECLPGFAQSIPNSRCIKNDTCHTSALWFWPLSLVYALVYSVYFLLISTPVSKKRQNAPEGIPPSWLADKLVHRPYLRRVFNALTGGSVNVVVFFFQMADSVVPVIGLATYIASNFKTFFGMQLIGGSNANTHKQEGFCVWPGMTAVAKFEMRLAIPVAMAVVLRIVVALAPYRKNCCRRKQHSGNPRPAPEFAHQRLPGAYAQLLLVGYTTLTQTTLHLLDCVTMPDTGTSVLLLAGAVKCGMWQAPLYILLAILILLPSMPIIVFCARQLPPSSWLGKAALAARFSRAPSAQAFVRSLTGGFRSNFWVWPAIQAIERLAMVAIPVFTSEAIESSIALAFVTLIMATMQQLFSPYINQDVNTHQAIAGSCLLALALLNIPQQALVQASVDVSDHFHEALGKVCTKIEDGMVFFLICPAVLPPLAWYVADRVSRKCSNDDTMDYCANESDGNGDEAGEEGEEGEARASTKLHMYCSHASLGSSNKDVLLPCQWPREEDG